MRTSTRLGERDRSGNDTAVVITTCGVIDGQGAGTGDSDACICGVRQATGGQGYRACGDTHDAIERADIQGTRVCVVDRPRPNAGSQTRHRVIGGERVILVGCQQGQAIRGHGATDIGRLRGDLDVAICRVGRDVTRPVQAVGLGGGHVGGISHGIQRRGVVRPI